MIYFIHRKTGQAGWLDHYFYLLNLSGFVMDTEGECETQKKYQCKELPPSSCLRWDTTSNRKKGIIPPQKTGRGEDPTSNRKRGRSHLKQEDPPLAPSVQVGSSPLSV
jgi:hypothetical protein